MLTGLLAEDGKERVVLKIQGGKLETIPRGQIDEMKTSPLSLMPEEIEKQFTPAGDRRPVRVSVPRQAAVRSDGQAAAWCGPIRRR